MLLLLLCWLVSSFAVWCAFLVGFFAVVLLTARALDVTRSLNDTRIDFGCDLLFEQKVTDPLRLTAALDPLYTPR